MRTAEIFLNVSGENIVTNGSECDIKWQLIEENKQFKKQPMNEHLGKIWFAIVNVGHTCIYHCKAYMMNF